jgi:hypothetical protein
MKTNVALLSSVLFHSVFIPTTRVKDFDAVACVHERRNSNTKAHGLARFFVSSETGRHVLLLRSPDEHWIPMLIDIE